MTVLSTVFAVIGIYLIVGLVGIAALDVLTGRVRRSLRQATADTQSKLVSSGNYVGARTATTLTILSLWLFWPAALIGACQSRKHKGVK